MTENRLYRTEQYAARADVDAEGLLKVGALEIQRLLCLRYGPDL